MQEAMRYDKGLGDAEIYCLLDNGSQYYDFTTKSFGSVTSNCQVFMAEFADADSTSSQSWYKCNFLAPSGGPFNITFKRASTGLVVGNDLTAPYAPDPNLEGSQITQICNMALGRIGISRFISDINEVSNEALICRQYIASVRDRCLSEFPWGFAMRYLPLTAIDSPPVTQFLVRYQYPPDCVSARFISPSYNGTTPPAGFTYNPNVIEMKAHQVPFSVVEDEGNGGLAIETNLLSAVLAYTARITTISLWPGTFINALVWLLASELASPLSGDPIRIAKNAGDAYVMAMLKAGADSMNEGSPTRPVESEFLRARY